MKIIVSIHLDPRRPEAQVLQYDEDKISPTTSFSFPIQRKVRKRIVFKPHFNRSIRLAYKFYEIVSKYTNTSTKKSTTIDLDVDEKHSESLMTDINNFLTNNKLSKYEYI